MAWVPGWGAMAAPVERSIITSGRRGRLRRPWTRAVWCRCRRMRTGGHVLGSVKTERNVAHAGPFHVPRPAEAALTYDSEFRASARITRRAELNDQRFVRLARFGAGWVSWGAGGCGRYGPCGSVWPACAACSLPVFVSACWGSRLGPRLGLGRAGLAGRLVVDQQVTCRASTSSVLGLRRVGRRAERSETNEAIAWWVAA